MEFSINAATCFLLVFAITIQMQAQSTFDLQGHRGCRGIMPENTLAAFLKATELGVNTLELDLVVNNEGKLIVSHEPWMSAKICQHPDGRPVLKNESMSLNIYKMPYSEIQTYDCGTRFHEAFPDQQKVKALKPTLTMVVKAVEKFSRDKNLLTPAYNIEIKSEPDKYDEFYPKPSIFVGLVVEEIRKLGIESTSTIQSFDENVLEELKMVADRKFKIAYLVEKGKKAEKQLKHLSFQPDIYSPNYKLVSKETIDYCHKNNIKVIPWTVNDKAIFNTLVSLGVDGIITDYPDTIRL